MLRGTAGKCLGFALCHEAGEIFELNRQLLSSPDLLPIGVELMLPARGDEFTLDHPVRRPLSVRQTFGSGLAPVRPVPLHSDVAPRAQLTRPIAAE